MLTALRPSIATIPNSKILTISTPYSQAGVLYESHKRHFGHDNAVLIAQSLARQPGLKTVHGAVQNALSLVIDRIAPNAPARPKEVMVITARGPIM